MKNKSLELLLNAIYKDQATDSIEIKVSENVSYGNESFFECVVYLDNGDNVLLKKVIEIKVLTGIGEGVIKLKPNPIKKFVIDTDIVSQIVNSDFSHFRLDDQVIEVEEIKSSIPANTFGCSVKGILNSEDDFDEDFELTFFIHELSSFMID